MQIRELGVEDAVRLLGYAPIWKRSRRRQISSYPAATGKDFPLIYWRHCSAANRWLLLSTEDTENWCGQDITDISSAGFTRKICRGDKENTQQPQTCGTLGENGFRMAQHTRQHR